MKNAKNGVDTIFIFTVALLSYAGASALGGNGYLSVYITGIILGSESALQGSLAPVLRDGKRVIPNGVKRDGQVLIPNGKTVLQEQDVLVISEL